jgi:hypothetical protein
MDEGEGEGQDEGGMMEGVGIPSSKCQLNIEKIKCS